MEKKSKMEKPIHTKVGEEVRGIELPNPYSKLHHRVEIPIWNDGGSEEIAYVDFDLEFYYFKTGPDEFTRMWFWKPKGARLDYSQAVSPAQWEHQKALYAEQDKQQSNAK